MSDMVHVPLERWLGPAFEWIQMILAVPVVFWAGWPFFQRAWQSLLRGHANMFTLIALGTAGILLQPRGR